MFVQWDICEFDSWEAVDEMACVCFRWKKASDEGRFEQETVPIVLKSKKGEVEFKVDEHPKETSLEKLAKLPPVFKKDGTVTAGNASVSLPACLLPLFL